MVDTAKERQDIVFLENFRNVVEAMPDASQRTIGRHLNMSVGMVNALIKRFVERGWVMIKNVNGCKLSYAMTPKGIGELYERGRAFAKRTFAAANECNQILYKAVENARKNGRIKVVLYGQSYIKFLIVYTCQCLGMQFEERDVADPFEQEALCFIGEQSDAETIAQLKSQGAISLVDLVKLVDF